MLEVLEETRYLAAMLRALGHAFLGLVWPGNPWSRRYLQLDFAWSLGFCPNWKEPPQLIPAPGDPPPDPPAPRCGYPPGEKPAS